MISRRLTIVIWLRKECKTNPWQSACQIIGTNDQAKRKVESRSRITEGSINNLIAQLGFDIACTSISINRCPYKFLTKVAPFNSKDPPSVAFNTGRVLPA